MPSPPRLQHLRKWWSAPAPPEHGHPRGEIIFRQVHRAACLQLHLMLFAFTFYNRAGLVGYWSSGIAHSPDAPV